MKVSYPQLLAAASLSLGLFPSEPAAAAPGYCDVKVSKISIERSGTVYATVTGAINVNWGHFCSVTTTEGAVTPAACEKWVSVLTAANLSGKTVELVNGGGCQNYGDWAVLSTHTNPVTYVGLK